MQTMKMMMKKTTLMGKKTSKHLKSSKRTSWNSRLSKRRRSLSHLWKACSIVRRHRTEIHLILSPQKLRVMIIMKIRRQVKKLKILINNRAKRKNRKCQKTSLKKMQSPLKIWQTIHISNSSSSSSKWSSVNRLRINLEACSDAKIQLKVSKKRMINDYTTETAENQCQ